MEKDTDKVETAEAPEEELKADEGDNEDEPVAETEDDPTDEDALLGNDDENEGE